MTELEALAKKLRTLSTADKLQFASELVRRGSFSLAMRVAEMAIHELTINELEPAGTIHEARPTSLPSAGSIEPEEKP